MGTGFGTSGFAETLLEELFYTRFRERHQPRELGFLRKRQVVEGHAILGALSECVQVALALGAEMDEGARRTVRAVLALDYALDTDADLERWLTGAEKEVVGRLGRNTDVQPPWRRLVSIRAARSDEEAVFLWTKEDDHQVGSSDLERVIEYAMNLPPVALGWAFAIPISHQRPSSFLGRSSKTASTGLCVRKLPVRSPFAGS